MINSISLIMKHQVPVVTATFPVDQSCQYDEGSFPYFKGLAESVMYVFTYSDNSMTIYVYVFYFYMFI